MGYSLFISRDEVFSAIKDLNNPRVLHCNNCNVNLELRHQRANRNSKFWGCPSWPNCNKTEDYFFEDRLAFIDYYNPNAKNKKGFSGELFILKYRNPSTKLIQAFSEKIYLQIAQRIGLGEFDFFITIPDSYGRENPTIEQLVNNGPLGQIQYLRGTVEQIRRGSQKDARTLEKRLKNVQGKYRLRDAQSIRGSNVLIIDDVVTSGASMHEVSWLIQEENQQSSYAASLGKNRRM